MRYPKTFTTRILMCLVEKDAAQCEGRELPPSLIGDYRSHLAVSLWGGVAFTVSSPETSAKLFWEVGGHTGLCGKILDLSGEHLLSMGKLPCGL